jgi:hypothetical protein
MATTVVLRQGGGRRNDHQGLARGLEDSILESRDARG